MERNQTTPIWVLAALVVVGWPTPALANVGTPLMWANMFHLLFGNALIGWLEGWLLARYFGAPRRRSALLMVAANYLSMTAGLFCFPWLVNRFGVPLLGDEPLYHLGPLLAGCMAAAYLASVVVEWPFCFAVLRDSPRRLARSWKASAAVQTASYALLIPLYAMVSPVSLWTDIEPDRSLSFPEASSTWVYFISPRDGNVYRARPDGKARERVAESEVSESNAKLTLKWSVDDDRWDLWVTARDEDFNERLLVQGLPIRPAESFLAAYGQREAGRDSLRSWDPAPDLRGLPPHQRSMQLWMSQWHGGSFTLGRLPDGGRIHVAMHTPVLNWAARNATLVSDELVVFQLAEQVVVLNPKTRRMGLLALGRGPLVVVEEPGGPAP